MAVLRLILFLILTSLLFTNTKGQSSEENAHEKIATFLSTLKAVDTLSESKIQEINQSASLLPVVSDSSIHFDYYFSIGKAYYNNGSYRLAFEAFEQAVDLLEYSPEDPIYECSILDYLGLTAIELHIKNRAIAYLEQALSCYKKHSIPEEKYVESANQLFGYLYDFNEYASAIQHSYSVKKLFDEVNQDLVDYVDLYTNISQCYIYLDDLDAAMKNINIAEKYFEKLDTDKINTLEIRMRGAKLTILLEKSTDNYDKILDYMDRWKKDFDSESASISDRTDFHFRQAGYRAMAYQYEEAMAHADTLVSLNTVRDPNGNLIVPELRNLKKSHFYIVIHAEIAMRLYKENGDVKLMEKSLNSIADILDIFDYRRRTYADMSGRKENLELIYSTIELICVIYWEALQVDLITPEEFWAFSEMYRSSHLKEFKYVRDIKDIYAGMDSSLIRGERKLMDSLHAVQNNKELKNRNPSAYYSNVSALLKDLFAFQQEMGRKYPDYYKQRLKLRYPEVVQVQNALNENQVLIEFVKGQIYHDLYSFIISKDTFYIKAIDTLKLEKDISKYYEAIRKHPLRENDRKTLLRNASSLDSLGIKIRTTLLDPLDIYRYPEWIIVPHQYLYYLPFNTLPLSDSSTNSILDCANRKRIVDKYQIQYAYSAQWWIEGLKNQTKLTNKGLALLPGKGNEEQLGFKERQTFKNRSGWKIKYPDTEKNMAGELEKSNFDLLYVATHAKYSREEDETFLIFDKEKEISSQEISRWPLRGKQVVLAACEGQLGPESQAEGMMSLSYYLAAAGAKSITGALWEVSDQSTERILSPESYAELNMNASQVHKSLLNYRAVESAINQHPYFWGGFWTFEQIDHPAAYSDSSITNWTILISAGAAYLLFIVYLIWRKKL